MYVTEGAAVLVIAQFFITDDEEFETELFPVRAYGAKDSIVGANVVSELITRIEVGTAI